MDSSDSLVTVKHMKTTFKHILVLTFIWFVIMVYKLQSSDKEKGDHSAKRFMFKLLPGRNKSGQVGKKILLWNPFFGEPDYGVGGFGTAAFERTNCPYTCHTTNDRSELEQADAVIVHTFNMGTTDEKNVLPKRTNEKQIFVFFILESPLRSYNGFFKSGLNFSDQFNLTFTFLDSPVTDIYIPMGGVTPRKAPDPTAVPRLKKIKQKNKMVAWFVSNCNPASLRNEYARELAKYIQVDIFGECGNLTCESGNVTCFMDINKSYLFYLSFENSFCKDYATEKLFRTLSTQMVPVVYGNFNYSNSLPPKSYIDVRDFASPQKLAHFLLDLNEFRKKYRDYFMWKQEYSVLREGDFKALGFCQLCTILNTKNYTYKNNFDPVKDYWNPEQLCPTSIQERKLVHLSR